MYDTLSSCGTSSQKKTLETAKRFYAKPQTIDNFGFARLDIFTEPNGNKFMHQRPYEQELWVTESGTTFEVLISRLHELGWINHTRPDVNHDAALLASVTNESFKPEHIQQLNTAIKQIKKDHRIVLKLQKPEMESLRVVRFSNTSFRNSSNFITQLLVCHIPWWRIKRRKLVTLLFIQVQKRNSFSVSSWDLCIRGLFWCCVRDPLWTLYHPQEKNTSQQHHGFWVYI